jgi:hypothetical protein
MMGYNNLHIDDVADDDVGDADLADHGDDPRRPDHE